MEYNLQKWLQPSFYSPQNNFNSSYPPNDFINPGIGSVVNLFSSYQPTYQSADNYSIQKEPLPEASLIQEGSGNLTSDTSE